MRIAEPLAWLTAAGMVVIAGERARQAHDRITAEREVPPVDPADVTVLVPIRSGDPLLARTLHRSVRTLAPARVLLLVDEDDPEAITAAERAVVDATHAEVRRCAPPAEGTHPKVGKLIAPAAAAAGPVALLDDDTVLPPGGLAALRGALDRGDLVTGLPVYQDGGGLWSRLVAAFVNGSAAMTYLPLADDPVTVNGMVLLISREALDRIGGLDAVGSATCDDYALARAVRGAGMRIVQSAQPAEVSTTVPGPVAYLRLMRRWMLFGTEVLRHDGNPRVLVNAALPTLLPVVGLTAAALARSSRAAAAVLGGVVTGSALAHRLRQRLIPGSPADAALLPVAAVLAPLHALTAMVGTRTVTWRGRRVRVSSEPRR